MDHPAERREFASPDQRYNLLVESADRWRTQFPRASLLRAGQDPPELCWVRELPHRFGPRAVVVSNDGHVLLVDEWINITSRYALMLLDRKNRLVVSYDFNAVVGALGVPLSEISSHARNGTWLSRDPRLSEDGKTVSIAAGGRILTIDLESGRISSAAR